MQALLAFSGYGMTKMTIICLVGRSLTFSSQTDCITFSS